MATIGDIDDQSQFKMWHNHLFRFNPTAPFGDPVSNNGYGYPLIDFDGGYPSPFAHLQLQGLNNSGLQAKLLTPNGPNQPLLHFLPKAWHIELKEEDWYLPDQINIKWLAGKHLLYRIGLYNYSIAGTESQVMKERFCIFYGAMISQFKYQAEFGPSTDPEQVGPSILNTAGDILLWDGRIPNITIHDIQSDFYMRLYIAANYDHFTLGGSSSDLIYPSSWTLFTSDYPTTPDEIGHQYFVYRAGQYQDGNPNGSPIRPIIGGMVHSDRPVSFVRPVFTYTPSASESLNMPATVYAYPYHGSERP